MTKKKTKAQKKISVVLDEFKSGTLNIGKSNKKVKNKAQAIAIALSEARKVGSKTPKKKKKAAVVVKKKPKKKTKVAIVVVTKKNSAKRKKKK